MQRGWTLYWKLTAQMTEKKMAERADPVPSSLYFCAERNSVHVHCPCKECRGKAVHYKTQERHLSALKLLQEENGELIHCLDHLLACALKNRM